MRMCLHGSSYHLRPPTPYSSPLTLHLSLCCILWLILPLLNTALAEPITLSPLPLPRAANPLPGLIEGDCISAGSRAKMESLETEWRFSPSLSMCHLHPATLIVSASFPFSFVSSFSSQRSECLLEPEGVYKLSARIPEEGMNALRL